ncbi:MAG: MMPL family transporter [Alphaproteobacteria bacterium]|nr:MMPL family transporter [Alphaproteobacteria bacterium]
MTFLPAYLMQMSEKTLESFSKIPSHKKESGLARMLKAFGSWTVRHRWIVIFMSLILLVGAVFGMMRIRVNDNPVKWFAEGHELRIADKELNARFSGTYMAYLTFKKEITVNDTQAFLVEAGFPKEILTEMREEKDLSSDLINKAYDYADSQDDSDAWGARIEIAEKRMQIFKDPESLKAIERLQKSLEKSDYVGKSSSLGDIVKTVHRDLYGKEEAFVIPGRSEKIAETLLMYQNSHRPDDLWHFVSPDYTRTAVFLQLKSGDNADMKKVVEAVDAFVKKDPVLKTFDSKWFGMTYINVVWQDKMVTGMTEAFLGSFLIVLLLMTILFRSFAWGALAMLPLTITIMGIYGLIGWIGKDYDMPIAVLSSLSLGLAVDYAIHFLERAREGVRVTKGKWCESVPTLFGEPARAIFRNVIVVSVGFTPLLFAPLVPYQTVGLFISAILFFAGAVSLGILPAVLDLFKKWIFTEPKDKGMTLLTKISIVLITLLIILENFMF